MHLEEIIELLAQNLGPEVVLAQDHRATPPAMHISLEHIVEVCQVLHTHKKTYFDYLACITALDNGPQANTLALIYHLYSIPYNQQIMIKILLAREMPGKALPEVPSVSHIWKGANWHEREAYDLVGIHFTNHPDLRRILLPSDWQGHPLRKDYTVQAQYHGIKTTY
ncbi:MAG: NADH-quinone oxidoreductase subunit C [Bacteroidota bacterium]